MKSVLAISAHPDDETLGAGGTLLAHAAAGDAVNWLVVTQPLPEWYPADTVVKAGEQVSAAAQAYKCAHYERLGFPTARLDTIPQADLIKSLGDAITKIRPQIVYVVHGGDVHSDHDAVFRAVMSVLKPFHMIKVGVERIMAYETHSSTEAAPAKAGGSFIPTVFRDVSKFMDRKVEIMSFFDTEKQSELMPRGASAIRALGRFRGATIGVEYAEAFQLVREISK